MKTNIVPDKYFPEGIAEKVTPAVLVRRIIGLSAFALLTMFIIGYFSASPAYHHLAENEAVIKVSITHNGKRLQACVKKTRAELAKLPPNMRAKMTCGRERTPVLLVVAIDGKEIYRHVSKPNGLSSDGASIFYQKLIVPTGTHEVSVLMRDSVRDEGFDFEYRDKVDLTSGRNFVVTFDEQNRKFKIY